ncbi:hypothetical protein ACFFOU_29640 [Pseudonocardia sulfidoxydans]|uniref:hypothetical protein n=1 Tax=Pseudonocardia sulfidoxydans TaxID=54011 RepID=UPI0027D9B97E|nr:hypothetical protein [Pseudonocardia sulfidoxydans]
MTASAAGSASDAGPVVAADATDDDIPVRRGSAVALAERPSLPRVGVTLVPAPRSTGGAQRVLRRKGSQATSAPVAAPDRDGDERSEPDRDPMVDTAVDIWSPEFWTPGTHTPAFGISTVRDPEALVPAQRGASGSPLFTPDTDDPDDAADVDAAVDAADSDAAAAPAGLAGDATDPKRAGGPPVDLDDPDVSVDADDPGRRGLARIPTKVKRTAALVVAAGSALTLVGTVASLPHVPTGTNAALQLDDSAAADPVTAGSSDAPPALDTTALVAAVQDAQQHAAQIATTQRAEAERRSAEAKAAADAKAAEAKAAEAKAAADKKAAEAKAAAARTTTAAGSANCGLSTGGLGGVKPWVANAAQFLGCLFGKPQMLGVGSRGNASDHPGGLALDFMVSKSVGDRLAACALRNKDALGITYVIWQQRINYGSGWKAMEDRGGATANHMDHVHLSFAKSAPGGTPVAC